MKKSYLQRIQDYVINNNMPYDVYYGVDILGGANSQEQIQKMVDDEIMRECNNYIEDPTELSINGFGSEYYTTEELKNIDPKLGVDIQTVTNFLCEYHNLKNDNSKEAQERKNVLESKIKEIMQTGYNIYQAMRCIQHKIKNTSKEFLSDSDLNLVTTMENQVRRCENFSPYKKIFNMAEELGKMEYDKASYQKSGDYNKANELNDQINEYTNKIREAVREYNLKDLAGIIKNKKNQVAEQNTVNGKVEIAGTIDEDLFNGLQVVLGITNQEFVREERESGKGI